MGILGLMMSRRIKYHSLISLIKRDGEISPLFHTHTHNQSRAISPSAYLFASEIRLVENDMVFISDYLPHTLLS